MEKKELTYLKYYISGGFIDNSDAHNLALNLYFSKFGSSADCSIRIGNITIAKEFRNFNGRINYPIIEQIKDLFNSIDLTKLSETSAIGDDISSAYIKYEYERELTAEEEEKYKDKSYEEKLKIRKMGATIENPNSEELLKLLNDFAYNYLLKDKELSNIFSSILNNSDHKLHNLNYIINNTNEFDINNYDLSEINNLVKYGEHNFIVKETISEYHHTTNRPNDNLTDEERKEKVNKMISKIEEKINELEKEDK